MSEPPNFAVAHESTFFYSLFPSGVSQYSEHTASGLMHTLLQTLEITLANIDNKKQNIVNISHVLCFHSMDRNSGQSFQHK